MQSINTEPTFSKLVYICRLNWSNPDSALRAKNFLQKGKTGKSRLKFNRFNSARRLWCSPLFAFLRPSELGEKSVFLPLRAAGTQLTHLIKFRSCSEREKFSCLRHDSVPIYSKARTTNSGWQSILNIDALTFTEKYSKPFKRFDC